MQLPPHAKVRVDGEELPDGYGVLIAEDDEEPQIVTMRSGPLAPWQRDLVAFLTRQGSDGCYRKTGERLPTQQIFAEWDDAGGHVRMSFHKGQGFLQRTVPAT